MKEHGESGPLARTLVLAALCCCLASAGCRQSGGGGGADAGDGGAGSSRTVRQDDGRFGKRPPCEHSILFRDEKAIVNEKWKSSAGEKKGDSR
ncbi:MAG: hypothetical protein R6V85_02415 [Polyangia bacterium]